MKRSPLARRAKPVGAAKTDAQKKRDAERKAREWARKYHSTDRVWFVANAVACAVPECMARDCENAHTETGGTGRKADYTTVTSLCRYHHRRLHDMGRDTFEAKYGCDLEQAAKLTQQAWELSGLDTVERARKDGRLARWLARGEA